MFSSPLNLLANHYGSDKGNVHGDKHRFAQIYDLAFSPLRPTVKKVAELGLARGAHEHQGPGAIARIPSPSVNMWADYFPAAHIYGFDIADFSAMAMESGRFTFLRGNVGQLADLSAFAELIGADVDIVIDDASHASFHQQLALRELLPRVRPGGFYVIEDLHFQPPSIEWNVPLVHKTIDWLEALREGTGLISPLWNENQLRIISGMIDIVITFTDTAVPGSRFRSATSIIRKKMFATS